MSSVLHEICTAKMEHVGRHQHLIPEIVFQEKAKLQEVPRGFCAAIAYKKAKNQPALIAEVKKASPSKGINRADFDPQRIAHTYEEAGATCVSVLTDQPYFKGLDEDFEAARQVISLPMIRKDFMLTPYQITESRALGADCILIIMAALDDTTAKDLSDRATDLGMDILFEVHDKLSPQAGREAAIRVHSTRRIGPRCRSAHRPSSAQAGSSARGFAAQLPSPCSSPVRAS